jgi:prolyl 4-hydroxylase
MAGFRWRRRPWAITVALFFASSVLSDPLTCSASYSIEENDPGLQEITFDIGQGAEVTWVYVQPNVTSFYRDISAVASHTMVNPAYKGRVCNFVNLSDKQLVLFLEKKQGPPIKVGTFDPMSGKGISALQGQTLHFADTAGRLIKLFHITTSSGSLYVYDPYHFKGYSEVTKSYVKMLPQTQQDLYYQWRQTIDFSEHYTTATGRPFLSHYGRQPPKHSLWRANYFGEEHWVTTRETHFDRMPDAQELQAIARLGRHRQLSNDEPRLLAEYRSPGTSITPPMNMTLKVLSCSPRVFEIQHFLSPIEAQHILDIAATKRLHESSTGPQTTGSNQNRRSQNTWILREESPIVDAIYRRAADLLRIDEALLRERPAEPNGNHSAMTEFSAAEPMQLVHYAPGQEYRTHVDFAYPRVDDPVQATRFATLLLYLNDDMEGGETSFPRWMNAETSRALKVQPKLGKAVLFYSQLPDSNVDDLSQHSALPVLEGEKWL